jgi:signal transduction histidine kinase
VLRYAVGATALSATAVLLWALWAGSTAGVHSAEGLSVSAWGFGVLALLVAAVSAALAGHFHAKAQLALQGPRLDAPSSLPAPGVEAEIELLIHAIPGPAWLLVGSTDGRNARLAHQNEAARALLREAGVTEPQDLDGLLRSLPPGLSEVARELQPGTSAQHGHWTVSLAQLRAPHGGPDAWATLLSLQLLAPVSAPDEEAVADHESFSYTVSHDLRAPIRVVEGFARILKEDYGRVLDRIGNDHLDRVLGAAARMNSMIDALLALSQLSTQPLARQPVNLSQLASFIVDDLKRDAPYRRAEVHVQPGLMAHGDPTLLRMVLENLLGNAWKYSAKVTVAQIGFEKVMHEGREVFVVRDNGAGFDMRFADRLFGVFQRLHSANDFQGTGVGLASVRRIVRRHGGDIWAESEVGQGARFYFTLR